jgi:hypothetical protein
MTTTNLDTVSNALVLEVKRPQMAGRYEKHFNVKAVSGLAVGDTVYFDVTLPDWVRTVCVSKRTDTANADTLTVQSQDPGLTIQPVLPIKTATAVQTKGSTDNTASNTVLMQLYPVGNTIRVLLTLATAVPTNCLLSLMLFDA